MNDMYSEVVKDLSQAFFFIVSAICLIVKTIHSMKKNKSKKKKHKK